MFDLAVIVVLSNCDKITWGKTRISILQEYVQISI